MPCTGMPFKLRYELESRVKEAPLVWDQLCRKFVSYFWPVAENALLSIVTRWKPGIYQPSIPNECSNHTGKLWKPVLEISGLQPFISLMMEGKGGGKKQDRVFKIHTFSMKNSLVSIYPHLHSLQFHFVAKLFSVHTYRNQDFGHST